MTELFCIDSCGVYSNSWCFSTHVRFWGREMQKEWFGLYNWTPPVLRGLFEEIFQIIYNVVTSITGIDVNEMQNWAQYFAKYLVGHENVYLVILLTVDWTRIRSFTHRHRWVQTSTHEGPTDGWLPHLEEERRRQAACRGGEAGVTHTHTHAVIWPLKTWCVVRP